MGRDIKFAGIHFHKHDDAGIAKVNVRNETTSTDIIVDALVDLYTADKDESLGEYEDFIYKILLDPEDDIYTITAQHSGDNNVNAVGPNYSVDIERYEITEELEDTTIDAQLLTWHSDYSSDIYTYDLIKNVITETDKIMWFNGDDVTTGFVLPSTIHASDFIEFTSDSGATWFLPTSTFIDWGDISPYTNEEIDTSTGSFAIVFETAPATGVNNVGIKYTPMVDKYKVLTTFNQPNDGADFSDYNAEVRLLDFGLEMIKGNDSI